MSDQSTVSIKEPNWQLMVMMIKTATGLSTSVLSYTCKVPENVLTKMLKTGGEDYQPKWRYGERLRVYALEVLTAEQLERCGVPFA